MFLSALVLGFLASGGISMAVIPVVGFLSDSLVISLASFFAVLIPSDPFLTSLVPSMMRIWSNSGGSS